MTLHTDRQTDVQTDPDRCCQASPAATDRTGWMDSSRVSGPSRERSEADSWGQSATGDGEIGRRMVGWRLASPDDGGLEVSICRLRGIPGCYVGV